MKYALIFIVVLLVMLFCLYLGIRHLLVAEPTIRVDYLAKYNEVTRPKGYDSNENAAGYYKKAFEAFVEIDDALRDGTKGWPGDLDDEGFEALKGWLEANSQAFEYLRAAAQKPFCWYERYSNGGDGLLYIDFPELADIRQVTYAAGVLAKTNAFEGDIESAFDRIIEVCQIGSHYCGGGSLIEQLVGLANNGRAFKTGLAILDRADVSSQEMEGFQKKLVGQLDKVKYGGLGEAEIMYGLDGIQQMFTDDGNGDGRLIPAKLMVYKNSYPLEPDISYLRAVMICLTHPGRRATVELQEKLYQELERLIDMTPWQLKQMGTNHDEYIKELTKGNYFVGDSPVSIGRTCELFSRGKVMGEALVATLAVLRYELDKGDLPVSLEELVSGGYLKELPMDPYSGGGLVYKKTDDDFILYSVGADFSDDGGRADKYWGEGQERGDYVFWPVEVGQ